MTCYQKKTVQSTWYTKAHCTYVCKQICHWSSTRIQGNWTEIYPHGPSYAARTKFYFWMLCHIYRIDTLGPSYHNVDWWYVSSEHCMNTTQTRIKRYSRIPVKVKSQCLKGSSADVTAYVPKRALMTLINTYTNDGWWHSCIVEKTRGFLNQYLHLMITVSTHIHVVTLDSQRFCCRLGNQLRAGICGCFYEQLVYRPSTSQNHTDHILTTVAKNVITADYQVLQTHLIIIATQHVDVKSLT